VTALTAPLQEAICRIMRFHLLEWQQTDIMCLGFASMLLMFRLRKGMQCWTVLSLRMMMYMMRLTFDTGIVLQRLDIDRLGKLGSSCHLSVNMLP
jgi:hypothetical protein